MLSQTIARILLDQKAVTLSPDKPYTFASGIK
ncbi:MAG TPA: orotate phosphoribosyltransferase, partial [bacterium]|nr:orotate phosphoribosyltransferase [bacterium]